MSKLCRLGESKALNVAKRRNLRKKMRELINQHVQPEMQAEFHTAFNKVCEAYCLSLMRH